MRMYKSHGIKPISALKGKILSKIPQFIEARLPWSEIPEAEEESLIQPDAANKKRIRIIYTGPNASMHEDRSWE